MTAVPGSADLPVPGAWESLGAVAPPALHDARLQLHHAAQVAVAAAISYLPPQPDDSHTNLGWSPAHRALVTRLVPAPQPFHVAILPGSLALAIVGAGGARGATIALDGHTVADALAWLSSAVTAAGLDASALTPRKHYEIPPHPVAGGAAFARRDGRAFDEMARWWSSAAALLAPLEAIPGASPVRCWPHHFDLATLLGLPPGPGGTTRTIGVGLSPGDDAYDEPYLYVGPSPSPHLGTPPPPLAAGRWNTAPWVGAVLAGSELVAAGPERAQAGLAAAFLGSAIAACRALLRR